MSKTKIFEPFFGEFGWEIMSWAPICRKIAQEYDESIITTFPGMEPLYQDFAKVITHNAVGRGLTYQKTYRVKPVGSFFKYGIPNEKYDLIIHARGASRKSNYNYKRWEEVVNALIPLGFRIAVVGSGQDMLLEGVSDERNIPLQELMNLLAGAKLLIGVSSGVMHLGASCGTNLVVWGDARTYFGETLEKRYKDTWNPFEVDVGYLYDDNFQPYPHRIVEKVERCLKIKNMQR